MSDIGAKVLDHALGLDQSALEAPKPITHEQQPNNALRTLGNIGQSVSKFGERVGKVARSPLGRIGGVLLSIFFPPAAPFVLAAPVVADALKGGGAFVADAARGEPVEALKNAAIDAGASIAQSVVPEPFGAIDQLATSLKRATPLGGSRTPTPLGQARAPRRLGDGIHAVASKAVYGDDARASAFLKEKGFSVDAELSNENYTTFASPEDGAILAYRGTQIWNPSDLLTNAAILTGTEYASGRFQEAHAVARKALDKYGRDALTLTGHSLGGTQALSASLNTKARAVVYNPAVGPGLLLRSGLSAFSKPEQTIYATKDDVVPLLGRLTSANKVYVPRKDGLGAHALDNFIDYSSIGQAPAPALQMPTPQPALVQGPPADVPFISQGASAATVAKAAAAVKNLVGSVKVPYLPAAKPPAAAPKNALKASKPAKVPALLAEKVLRAAPKPTTTNKASASKAGRSVAGVAQKASVRQGKKKKQ